MNNNTLKTPRLKWNHAMRVNLMERLAEEFGTLDDWYENATGTNPRPKNWKAYNRFCEQYHRDSLVAQGKPLADTAKYGGAVRNQVAWVITRQPKVRKDMSMTMMKMYAAAHDAGFVRAKHFPNLKTNW